MLHAVARMLTPTTTSAQQAHLSSLPCTSCPPTLSTASPSCTPAWAAGLPSTTKDTTSSCCCCGPPGAALLFAAGTASCCSPRPVATIYGSDSTTAQHSTGAASQPRCQAHGLGGLRSGGARLRHCCCMMTTIVEQDDTCSMALAPQQLPDSANHYQCCSARTLPSSSAASAARSSSCSSRV